MRLRLDSGPDDARRQTRTAADREMVEICFIFNETPSSKTLKSRVNSARERVRRVAPGIHGHTPGHLRSLTRDETPPHGGLHVSSQRSRESWDSGRDETTMLPSSNTAAVHGVFSHPLSVLSCGAFGRHSLRPTHPRITKALPRSLHIGKALRLRSPQDTRASETCNGGGACEIGRFTIRLYRARASSSSSWVPSHCPP